MTSKIYHILIDMKTEEVDDAYLDALDEYIGAEIVVPGKDALPVLGKVKKRKRDFQGNPIGEYNPNPILDSRIYELEFPDGRIEEYSVNVLAESLLEQADDDGWDSGVVDEFVDFRKDDSKAIPIQKGTFETSTGQTRKVITTKGWEVQVRWKDKSTSWISLKDAKNSNPGGLAELAVSRGVENEPAFKWWVPSALREKKRLISRLVSRRVRKGRMKFGIMVPGSVEEAIELDRINNNTFWQDAIKKEMKNSRCAFELQARGAPIPVGSTEITCHLVFDIKLDMTRKARYVAGGHLTDVPPSMTYSSVVSRDTVRIGFLMAALNDLDVLAGDIQNAFLSAPTKEKVHFYAGKEWKADEGRLVVVVRALYGLKSSALQFINHLGHKWGFESSFVDPDLWYKSSTAKGGFKYYAYVLVYVDDFLIIDKQPAKFMEMLNNPLQSNRKVLRKLHCV